MAESTSTHHREPKTLARRRCCLAALVVLVCGCTMRHAAGQTVSYYAGKNSVGGDVEVYTVEQGQPPLVQSIGFSGKQHCDGALFPGEFGGNTDGTELYPIIDGRATFSELRPDFYIAADMMFVGTKRIEGTVVYKRAAYTGPDFPPTDRDTAACTTGKLTFTATYVGSLVLTGAAPSAHAQTAK